MQTTRWGTAATLFVLLAMGAATAWQSSSAQELAGDVNAGKLIYEQRCQRCHGTGGWGDGPRADTLRVPPANFHGPMVKLKSDEQLLTSIEFGVVLSPMHAWRGRLSEQEMRDVLAYVRLLGQRGK